MAPRKPSNRADIAPTAEAPTPATGRARAAKNPAPESQKSAPERLHTITELAALIGIPASELRAAAAQRRFETVRLSDGGKYRVTESAVRAWIARCTLPAQVERPTAEPSPLADLMGTPDDRLM